MKLQILTFGIARDIMGGSTVPLTIMGTATVSQLKKELLQKYPDLRGLAFVMIAVNNAYAVDTDLLRETDEIAIIPPVSGG